MTSKFPTKEGEVKITHLTSFSAGQILESIKNSTPINGHRSTSKIGKFKVVLRHAPGIIAQSASTAFKHLRQAAGTGILEYPIALVESSNGAHVLTLERPFFNPFINASEEEKTMSGIKIMKGIARLHFKKIGYGKTEANANATPTGRIVLTDFIGLQELFKPMQEAKALAKHFAKEINPNDNTLESKLTNTYLLEIMKLSAKKT
ncbi:hypothetical protein HUU53_04190 [Candidatus Micrarchaeota archaeon]|nr:hypothetical protein [Candidatus Micrarchaeota archaeon]